MKYGTTRGETVERRRQASRQTTLYSLLIVFILLGNVALAYFAMRAEPPEPPIPVELGGVVEIQMGTGIGTGFLVTERYVLTAAHVVGDRGGAVQAVFEDGRSVGGTVIASGYPELQAYATGPSTSAAGATPHDWALVQLDAPQAAGLILPLGTTATLQEGTDEVLAVGYPGGERNVSRGVISGRTSDALRTDAPIDPGYSGGPLVSISQLGVVGILVSVPYIGVDSTVSASVRNAVPIEVALDRCRRAGFHIQ